MDDVRVDSARDAVLSLDIKLRGLISGDGGVIHDITLGGGINHVADHEALGGLVLRDEVVALVAPDTINVTTAGLVASSVSSLLGHFSVGIKQQHSRVNTGVIRAKQTKNTVSFKLQNSLGHLLYSLLILDRSLARILLVSLRFTLIIGLQWTTR